MKKTLIVIMALMMALVVLCSACKGGDANSGTPANSGTQSGELPTVTKPPEGEEDALGVVGANANDDSLAAQGMDRDSWLATLSEEQRLVETELLGATVEELYAAIGEPNDAVYGTSCFIANGEDGVLYYDGFMVGTTRYPDGKEIVTGTSN